MLGMPVATLRVWERRYALTDTTRSPSGQRLYTADDVQRLALVKQLADLGHAIGRIAPLALEQLQQVVATHAQALATTRRAAPLAPGRWRVVVVGATLGARLQRPALQRLLGRPLEVVGPYADVAEAAAAMDAMPDAPPPAAWLVQAAQLHPGWWPTFESVAGPRAAWPVGLVVGIAAEAVCEDLAHRGVVLLREPQPDVALAQWLRLWAQSLDTWQDAPASGSVPEPSNTPPRRWSDTALADFAALSRTVACECPRHLSELLVQLSRFEAYSSECAHRSPADAALHADLGRAAARSRVALEQALEQVARREGLLLPAPGGSFSAGGR